MRGFLRNFLKSGTKSKRRTKHRGAGKGRGWRADRRRSLGPEQLECRSLLSAVGGASHLPANLTDRDTFDHRPLPGGEAVEIARDHRELHAQRPGSNGGRGDFSGRGTPHIPGSTSRVDRFPPEGEFAADRPVAALAPPSPPIARPAAPPVFDSLRPVSLTSPPTSTLIPLEPSRPLTALPAVAVPPQVSPLGAAARLESPLAHSVDSLFALPQWDVRHLLGLSADDASEQCSQVGRLRTGRVAASFETTTWPVSRQAPADQLIPKTEQNDDPLTDPERVLAAGDADDDDGMIELIPSIVERIGHSSRRTRSREAIAPSRQRSTAPETCSTKLWQVVGGGNRRLESNTVRDAQEIRELISANVVLKPLREIDDGGEGSEGMIELLALDRAISELPSRRPTSSGSPGEPALGEVQIELDQGVGMYRAVEVLDPSPPPKANDDPRGEL